MTTPPDSSQRWRVILACCGRDAGVYDADTWEAADAFRESYTSGPGVNEHGYSSHGSGRQRSGVITKIGEKPTP